MDFDPTHKGCISRVAGIEVGHFTDARGPTGCSVVLARSGAVAGVDVRGAAPGTRETDLLAPGNLVQQVHAVMLAGGSAYGLDAASGAMRWLEENGIGLDVGVARVPIVPAAVLFDLMVGDPSIRPSADAGYAACAAAAPGPVAQGNVGAGSGAAVGKLFGMARAMRGGIGSASVTAGPFTVGALVACNAVGDVIDPQTGQTIAGARTEDGTQLLHTRQALLSGASPQRLLPGTNTTIGVVATDARLCKAQAQRLAMVAHDGLARSINPAHTQLDGDTLFSLATGTVLAEPDMLLLATMAAEATACAVISAIWAADSWHGGDLPAARQWHAERKTTGSR